MRREALKVERCTLNVGRQRGGALRRVGMRREALKVERGTTMWRGAATLCPDRQRGPSRGQREARGDEARGVEGCTLHVERGTTTWRGAATLCPDRQRGPSRRRREVLPVSGGAGRFDP